MIECMHTLTGNAVETPEVEVIADELDRLARGERGASITLDTRSHHMRIKYTRGYGYHVLTYRDDFRIEQMVVIGGAQTTPENDVDDLHHARESAGKVMDFVTSFAVH